MPKSRLADEPFNVVLPRLLAERGLTVRALAREVGGIDHRYLGRMIRREAPINVRHVQRISKYLDLPDGFFIEAREAAVIDAIRADPVLRDELYARIMSRSRKSAPESRRRR